MLHNLKDGVGQFSGKIRREAYIHSYETHNAKKLESFSYSLVAVIVVLLRFV